MPLNPQVVLTGAKSGLRQLLAALESTGLPAFARAATTSPSGELLTRALMPSEAEMLREAKLLMRRKSLSDIAGPQRRMLNVHESGKTGAAAGVARSKEIRSVAEPQMFGETSNPTYGYLASDPFHSLTDPLSFHYPKTGEEYLSPDNALSGYGSYLFELNPDARRAATFTLDDSLDRSRGNYATASDLLKAGSDINDSAAQGSKLFELAEKYKDLRDTVGKQSGFDSWELNKALREAGHPERFADLLEQHGYGLLRRDTGTPQFPRQIPRPLADLENAPALMPSEIYSIGDKDDLARKLAGKDWGGYIEAQMHEPVTPDMISRVYDLNYEPSLAAEKKVRSLGLEYVPRPRTTAYDLLKENPVTNVGEMYDLFARQMPEGIAPGSLRNSAEFGPLRKWQQDRRSDPVPRFKFGYKRGGLAQMKECSCHG